MKTIPCSTVLPNIGPVYVSFSPLKLVHCLYLEFQSQVCICFHVLSDSELITFGLKSQWIKFPIRDNTNQDPNQKLVLGIPETGIRTEWNTMRLQ